MPAMPPVCPTLGPGDSMHHDRPLDSVRTASRLLSCLLFIYGIRIWERNEPAADEAICAYRMGVGEP
jgi:hypothetical protein